MPRLLPFSRLALSCSLSLFGCNGLPWGPSSEQEATSPDAATNASDEGANNAQVPKKPTVTDVALTAGTAAALSLGAGVAAAGKAADLTLDLTQELVQEIAHPTPRTPGQLGKDLIRNAHLGDLREVKALIAAGADVNARNDEGQTALIAASCSASTEIDFPDMAGIAQALVAAGIDVNARDPQGKTALIYASKAGALSFVKVLLEARADLNAIAPDEGTALYYAADKRHVETVKALIAAGADVNAATSPDDTPLSTATVRLNTQKHRLGLLVAGDDNARSATQTAIRQYEEIVQALIAAGAR